MATYIDSFLDSSCTKVLTSYRGDEIPTSYSRSPLVVLSMYSIVISSVLWPKQKLTKGSAHSQMSQFTINTDFRIRHLILINASVRPGRVSMAVAGFTFMHMLCSLWVEGMGSADISRVNPRFVTYQWHTPKQKPLWAPGSLSMKWGDILLKVWRNIKTVCREHGQLRVARCRNVPQRSEQLWTVWQPWEPKVPTHTTAPKAFGRV